MEGDSHGGPVSDILVHSERQDPHRSPRLLPERSQKVVRFPRIRRKKSESLIYFVDGTDNKGSIKTTIWACFIMCVSKRSRTFQMIMSVP